MAFRVKTRRFEVDLKYLDSSLNVEITGDQKIEGKLITIFVLVILEEILENAKYVVKILFMGSLFNTPFP